MKDINKTLGERINLLRKNLNITREKLAEKVDVSPRFLADVESGKVGVSLLTLKNLCIALSTTADYLLGLKSDENENSAGNIANKFSMVDARYYPLLNVILEELIALK